MSDTITTGPPELPQVPIDSVTEHPDNARRGDVEAIKVSLETHGQYSPIVVQKSTGHIVKGNHTYRAAKELGWQTIGAVHIDVDDDRAARIMLVDNATSDSGTYDAQALQDLIDQLEGDLSGTGYDEASIDDLLRTLGGELPQVEHVPISDLSPHPRNYQRHSDEQIRQIAASIREHGFYRAVVTSETGVILAGHGVVQAARMLDLPLIPIIRLPIGPDDPRAIRVMTGDNELNNMAEVDDAALTELLRELYGEGGDQALVGTGFDAEQLAALVMVTRPSSEIQRMDEAAEWIGMPGYVKSELIPILNIQFDSYAERAAFVEQHLQGAHVRAAGGLGPADAKGPNNLGGLTLRQNGSDWQVLDGDEVVASYPTKSEAVQKTRKERSRIWSTAWPPRDENDRQAVEWQATA